MGMLAPLYALAALAVVGPIVFHLIRRQPQGQQKFSSLMFLRPSPPKLTRRSRLDHWLLLALRMIALALIAFAFARPYFRERSLLDIDLSGRNVVLLLDTSASMRRPDVWQKAQEAIQQVIDSLANNDHLSLYAIDNRLLPIVAVEDSYRMEAQTAQQAVRTAAADLEPSWQSTELAAGLTGLADTLNAATVSGPLAPGMTSEIVLVTDLHTNSGIEPLQGYPWPENVQLDVRRIQPETPGNARPSWMPQADDADDDRIRIRIENNQQSEQQTFQLAWANADGIEESRATRVQVPAGQVRVVPMAGNARGSYRIRLIGDAWDADNDVILVRTEPLRQTILYVGRSEAEAEDDPAYFLTKAPINSSDVERQIVFLEENDLPTALEDSQVAAVIIEPGFGLAQHAQRLRQFVESGRTVMVNLARPLASEALQEETTAFLRALLNVDSLGIREAAVEDFALVGKLDYQSSLFRPFADPRYNNFSKLRIWNHRKIELPEQPDSLPSGLDVVAFLDSGDPWIVQQNFERGNIWLLAAGWQPTSSTFALSSKFLPILLGMLDPRGNTRVQDWTYEVGESIAVEEDVLEILDAEGTRVTEEVARLGPSQVVFSEPGIYQLVSAERQRRVSIRIPFSESKLDALDSEVFEQYGVQLGRTVTDTERKESARQLKVEELEGKQKLWQWLLAAGIVILIAETFLGGWTARRAARQLATS